MATTNCTTTVLDTNEQLLSTAYKIESLGKTINGITTASQDSTEQGKFDLSASDVPSIASMIIELSLQQQELLDSPSGASTRARVQSARADEVMPHFSDRSQEKCIRDSAEIAHTIRALTKIHRQLGLRSDHPGVSDWYNPNLDSLLVNSIKLLTDFQGSLLSGLCDQIQHIKDDGTLIVELRGCDHEYE